MSPEPSTSSLVPQLPREQVEPDVQDVLAGDGMGNEVDYDGAVFHDDDDGGDYDPPQANSPVHDLDHSKCQETRPKPVTCEDEDPSERSKPDLSTISKGVEPEKLRANSPLPIDGGISFGLDGAEPEKSTVEEVGEETETGRRHQSPNLSSLNEDSLLSGIDEFPFASPVIPDVKTPELPSVGKKRLPGAQVRSPFMHLALTSRAYLLFLTVGQDHDAATKKRRLNNDSKPDFDSDDPCNGPDSPRGHSQVQDSTVIDEPGSILDETRRQPPDRISASLLRLLDDFVDLSSLRQQSWLQGRIINAVFDSLLGPILDSCDTIDSTLLQPLVSDLPGTHLACTKLSKSVRPVAYIPLNLDNQHWVLALVDRRRREVGLFDSLPSPSTPQLVEDKMEYFVQRFLRSHD